jgi:hypothetical protein
VNTDNEIVFSTRVSPGYFLSQAFLLLLMLLCLIFVKVNIAGLLSLFFFLLFIFILKPIKRITVYSGHFSVKEHYLIPLLDKSDDFYYNEVEEVKYKEASAGLRLIAFVLNKSGPNDFFIVLFKDGSAGKYRLNALASDQFSAAKTINSHIKKSAQ